MREIKFRGKDLVTGELRYGFYVHDVEWGNHYIYQQVKGPVYYQLRSFEIDGNTVGQYTGLKDNNGKEIYEGDLLDKSSGPIVACMFNLKRWDNYYVRLGNIHDNKELLK